MPRARAKGHLCQELAGRAPSPYHHQLASPSAGDDRSGSSSSGSSSSSSSSSSGSMGPREAKAGPKRSRVPAHLPASAVAHGGGGSDGLPIQLSRVCVKCHALKAKCSGDIPCTR